MNVVIVLEWVWRERNILDEAHPARMLVVDNAGPRTRAKLQGSTRSTLVGERYDRSLFFSRWRGECEKRSKRGGAMLEEYPAGK